MRPAAPVRPLAMQVLRSLREDDFVSGEALATRLGVSRPAIWQAVKQLESLGLAINKVRRRGYRLANAFDALDAAQINTGLSEATRTHHCVSVTDSCASTNLAVLGFEGATQLQAPWPVLAVELQTAGRGRRGRSWQSGLGNALTFSLVRHFRSGPARLSALSLVAALAVAEGLRACGANGVRLKWPNDVVIERDGALAKLCGILIELSGEAEGPCRAVIGIGINVRLDARERAAIEQAVADLKDCGVNVSRNALLAAILNALNDLLARFEHEGFAPLTPTFDALNAHLGSEVVLTSDGQVLHAGKVRGVDAQGMLLLETAQGPVRAFSGELSLRLSR